MMTLTTEAVRIVVFDDPDHAPCRRMLAAVRHVAAQRSDIDVEHVNVWLDPDSGVEHKVMTVPTTIVFVGGEEQKRLVGLRSTHSLTRTIDHIVVKRAAPAPVG